MPAALLLSSVSDGCLAQSATPGSTISLDPIVVEQSRRPVRSTARAPTSRPARPAPREPVSINASEQAADNVRKRLNVLPGGVALVPQQDYTNAGNPTLAAALSGVPGVVLQSFFGGNDQPRIQIRGSGLQQNPVERGVLVLYNGLPINRADGSYIVGFANPRQAESLEVYRGYMANRLGATVLGGAINFVSPTGSTQPGSQLTVSGGSFGQINTSGQTGFKKDNADGLLQFDTSHRSGFRDYNSSERVSVNGNIGVALSENVKTRVFMGYTDLGGYNKLSQIAKGMMLSGNTLPQVSAAGGSISGTYHVITTDGAGPIAAVLDPTGTGKFSSGVPLTVATQVPGDKGYYIAMKRNLWTRALEFMGLEKRAKNVNLDFVSLPPCVLDGFAVLTEL